VDPLYPSARAVQGSDTAYVAVAPRTHGRRPAHEASTSPVPGRRGGCAIQLQYAVAELSTHDNQRVQRPLTRELQAALTGAKKLPTRRERMRSGRAEADPAALPPLMRLAGWRRGGAAAGGRGSREHADSLARGLH